MKVTFKYKVWELRAEVSCASGKLPIGTLVVKVKVVGNPISKYYCSELGYIDRVGYESIFDNCTSYHSKGMPINYYSKGIQEFLMNSVKELILNKNASK